MEQVKFLVNHTLLTGWRLFPWAVLCASWMTTTSKLPSVSILAQMQMLGNHWLQKSIPFLLFNKSLSCPPWHSNLNSSLKVFFAWMCIPAILKLQRLNGGNRKQPNGLIFFLFSQGVSAKMSLVLPVTRFLVGGLWQFQTKSYLICYIVFSYFLNLSF